MEAGFTGWQGFSIGSAQSNRSEDSVLSGWAVSTKRGKGTRKRQGSGSQGQCPGSKLPFEGGARGVAIKTTGHTLRSPQKHCTDNPRGRGTGSPSGESALLVPPLGGSQACWAIWPPAHMKKVTERSPRGWGGRALTPGLRPAPAKNMKSTTWSGLTCSGSRNTYQSTPVLQGGVVRLPLQGEDHGGACVCLCACQGSRVQGRDSPGTPRSARRPGAGPHL